mmetsp:Transcript_49761/g.125080  ORF Transcript_49761/g.125080 Transcript_49761/m.125080 type:complete len:529 (-) Transcript_49761:62-1648(-)
MIRQSLFITVLLLLCCGQLHEPFFFSFGVSIAQAGFIKYDRELNSGSHRTSAFAFYTHDDTPSKGRSGDGFPHLAFDLHFETDNQQSTSGQVEVIAFDYADYRNIGAYIPGMGRRLCCTPETGYPTRCRSNGRVMFSSAIQNRADFRHEVLPLLNGTAELVLSFEPTTKGIHVVYVVNCQQDPSFDVHLSGTIAFSNPFGYLSGDDYGFLIFYESMFAVYLVMLLAWIVACVYFREGLLAIQVCIGSLMFVGLVESLFYQLFYMTYNQSGHVSYALLFLAVFFNTLKQTFSRLLLLLVALGYPVVRRSIGPWATKTGVIALTALYFVFCLWSEALGSLREMTAIEVPLLWYLYFSVPLSVLNGIFAGWVIVAMVKTSQSLPRQPVKRAIYRKLLFLILVLALIGLVATVLETLLMAGPARYANSWPWWWVWDALWQGLYAAVFLGVAALLRPNSNNTRFGYSELDDEEAEFSEQDDIAMAEMGVEVHEQSTDHAGSSDDNVDAGRGHLESDAETDIRSDVVVVDVHGV